MVWQPTVVRNKQQARSAKVVIYEAFVEDYLPTRPSRINAGLKASLETLILNKLATLYDGEVHALQQALEAWVGAKAVEERINVQKRHA